MQSWNNTALQTSENYLDQESLHKLTLRIISIIIHHFKHIL